MNAIKLTENKPSPAGEGQDEGDKMYDFVLLTQPSPAREC